MASLKCTVTSCNEETPVEPGCYRLEDIQRATPLTCEKETPVEPGCYRLEDIQRKTPMTHEEIVKRQSEIRHEVEEQVRAQIRREVEEQVRAECEVEEQVRAQIRREVEEQVRAEIHHLMKETMRAEIKRKEEEEQILIAARKAEEVQAIYKTDAARKAEEKHKADVVYKAEAMRKGCAYLLKRNIELVIPHTNMDKSLMILIEQQYETVYKFSIGLAEYIPSQHAFLSALFYKIKEEQKQIQEKQTHLSTQHEVVKKVDKWTCEEGVVRVWKYKGKKYLRNSFNAVWEYDEKTKDYGKWIGVYVPSIDKFDLAAKDPYVEYAELTHDEYDVEYVTLTHAEYHSMRQEEARKRSAARIKAAEFSVWMKYENEYRMGTPQELFTKGHHVWTSDRTPITIDGKVCMGPRLGSYMGINFGGIHFSMCGISRNCTTFNGMTYDGTVEPRLY